MTKLPVALTLAVLCLLAAVPTALADQSSNGGYGDPGDRTQIDVNVNADTNASENAQDEGSRGVLGESASSPAPAQQVAGARASSPGASGGAPGPPTGGSLPFTGLDLSFIVGVGLVLLGMGIGLRQATRRITPIDPA